MKKRLVSLLLTTAFVLVAGAAFAWNNTVPTTGDLVFSVGSDDLTGTHAEVSGDLKDDLFSFGPGMKSDTEASIDKWIFGAGQTIPTSGEAFVALKNYNTSNDILILRLPVTGKGETKEIPVTFFGNTSLDKTVSFDLTIGKFNDSANMDLKFPGVAGVTSKDKQSANLTVTISKDEYGQFGPFEAGVFSDIDDLHFVADAAGKGKKLASFDIYVFALKDKPSVRITYTHDGNPQTPIIKDLVKDVTNTIEIPTMMGRDDVVKITKVENIGNVRLAPSEDSSTISDDKFKGLTEFFAGAKCDSPSLNLSPGQTKAKFLFSDTHTVKVTWVGKISMDVIKVSPDVSVASKDSFGLTSFDVMKTDDLEDELISVDASKKNILFATKIIDVDFTSSSDVFKVYGENVKDGLAAVGFNLKAQNAPRGDQILMVAVNVGFEFASNDVLSKDFKIFKAFKNSRGATDAIDLKKVIKDAGLTYGDFVTVSENNKGKSLVTIKNLFLADGGTAGLKVEEIAKKKVLVFYDGNRDGWFKDPIGVAKTVTPYVDPVTPPTDPTDPVTPVVPVDPEDPEVKKYAISGIVTYFGGAGAEGVEVKLWDNNDKAIKSYTTDKTGVYSLTEVPAGEYDGLSFRLSGYQQVWIEVKSLTGDLDNQNAFLKEGTSLRLYGSLGDSGYTGKVTFVVKDKDGKEVDLTERANPNQYRVEVPRGEYTVTATVDAGFSVKLILDDKEVSSFTVDETTDSRMVILGVVTANAGGGSSGGGCNVGFAPLALLLLAPVMFLKK